MNISKINKVFLTFKCVMIYNINFYYNFKIFH